MSMLWRGRNLSIMKLISGMISLLLVLVAAWLANVKVMAQSQPVFLRLTGLAVGGSPGYFTDLQVAGGFAYLAWASDNWAGATNHEGGLEIYSLANPSAPIRVGGATGGTWANAVQVVGQYAYLAEGVVRTYTNDPGALEIIDVSNPASPVRLGGKGTLGRATAVRVVGNYAYVAESTRWTGTNLLGTLEIFDVSTPTNPVRVANFDTAGSATSVDVSGNQAYLVDGVTDLQVLDVSDPSLPWRTGIYQPDLSRCAFEPQGPADSVQVVGNLAYSTGGHGLNVLDISDPSQPVRVLDNTCIPIDSFRLAGHYAFATIFHSSFNTYFLYISDTTNPTNWVTVGLKENWRPGPMRVDGNLIYLANNPLLVYEITDRPAITSLSFRGESLALTWDFAPGFVLQRTASLADPQWSNVPSSEGQTSLQLSITGSKEFFRLARP